MQEGKLVVRGGLQIAERRRDVKSKGERERYPTECKIPENNK